MSNINGKAYGMNVITPLRKNAAWVNRLIFSIARVKPSVLKGLLTLSLIHYAGWIIISPRQFPRLSPQQPKESLSYTYMLFNSNFNGSWDQYIDSFVFTIARGLDLLWKFTVRYPESVPLTPFHDYIRYNQYNTDYYYIAYPMASSNDVKAGKRVLGSLQEFNRNSLAKPAEEFKQDYIAMITRLQNDLGDMYPSPIVSLASSKVRENERSLAVRTASAHKSKA